jgi:branched-chain amino acid aminotransferase
VSHVWIDGLLVEERDARVSPLDRGLLVGEGVFETLRIYGGQPFAWRRHLDRLEASARGLGLPAPERGRLRVAAAELLAIDGVDEGRLRITITGGPGALGPEDAGGPPTVIVAAAPIGPAPGPGAVVVVPWPRNERGATAGLKTISYAENVRARAYANERGATEAVFANTRDELCEATGSNVFVVSAGVVRTPPAGAGCLLGVTRALVLELCAAEGVVAEEVALPVSALAAADEAFLTSTTREVQAIAGVDDSPLPVAPGPVTARLDRAFRALVTRDLDP